MKTITAISLAALLSLGAPGLALAQASPTPLGTDNALVTGSNDVDTFMKGIGSADFTSAMSVLSSANSIVVIPISGMDGANQDQFNTTMTSQQANIQSLQDRVSQNPKALQVLQASGYSADQVVGIDAAADGSVQLYVNDFGAVNG
jgi:hypothetical protein